MKLIPCRVVPGIALLFLLLSTSVNAQPCPTLNGSITGSNTCNNAPGMLTFHVAKASSAQGPFTLTYTDGVTTFTSSNVQDEVPFPVQVQPTATTTYTLLSIQDQSGCVPTIVAPGLTATISTGSCTLCTGALGDPVVNVNFGTGNGSSPDIGTAVPGASTVGLTYVPVSGNPAQPTPQDGQYTITNNVPFNSAWFQGSADHTPNDVNGYMLFVNVGTTPGEFFRQKVTGLCSGTKYEFAAWVGNADNPAVINAILPDLTFIVQTEDGTVLQVYNTGPVPQSAAWTWRQYGFFFTLPAGISTVIVRMVDNNPGGTVQPGNDFAIDDITFRACGPVSEASFSNTAAVTSKKICEGAGSTTLYGAIATGFASPQQFWQRSSDKGATWTDIPNSNSLQISVTTPVTGQTTDYYYRMVSADGANIQSPACRVTSNVIILTSDYFVTTDFTFAQEICTPLQIKFSADAQPGFVYTWTIEGSDYLVTNSADLPHLFSTAGNYPVKLKVFDGACEATVTKNISVKVQPAELVLPNDTNICLGSKVALRAKKALEFCWNPVTYLDNPTSDNPTSNPPVTTKYQYTAKIMGPNLIVNGDFSSGNTGFISDYTFTTNGSPPAMYGIANVATLFLPNAAPCKDHTSGNGNMMIINGSDKEGDRIWSETVKVQPNTDYAFSAWLESITGVNPAKLQFSINGQRLGSVFTASTSTCVWDKFYTVWNSGAATTAVFSIVNKNAVNAGNDFAIDDLSFSTVTMQTDSVTIMVNAVPVITAKPDTVICANIPLQLHATGAGANGTYAWTPAATLSDPASATPIARPEVSTRYIVIGTTDKGCAAKDTVDVDLYYTPYIQVSADTAICSGDVINLHVDAGPGAGYTWTPAGVVDNPSSANPTGSPSADTTFRVSITDANGCIEKDSVKVFIRPAPAFVQPLGIVLCDGTSGILGRNDYMHYVYVWTPATGLSDPTAPRPIVTPAATSRYSVLISDSTCPRYNRSFTVGVTVNANPIVTASKMHDIDCSQPSTQIQASGAFRYTWFPPLGLSDTASATPTVSIDSSMDYFVTGVDRNGCYGYDHITVNVKSIGKNLFVVPNAFTPNGDGHNDCYGIQRWGAIELEEFSIFNRVGYRVFTTRNPSQCWDGTVNGHPQPAGSYVYLIRAKTFCGPVMRSGNLTLVR